MRRITRSLILVLQTSHRAGRTLLTEGKTTEKVACPLFSLRFLLAFALVLACTANPGRAGAAPVLDQQYDPGSSGGSAVVGELPQFNLVFDIAQTFTVGLSGLLTSIDVFMVKGNNPTENVTLEIQTSAGGIHSSAGTGLGSASLPPSAFSTSGGFVSFDLSSQNIQVLAGQTLAFVLSSPQNFSGSNRYDISFNNANGGYPGGAVCQGNVDTGGCAAIGGDSSRDSRFRTFVDQCQSGQATGDLVSWWRAEDDACDSADANHGVLVNGATATAAGKVGQAFSFDGGNDHVKVPDAPNLDLSGGSFTIKAWVNPQGPVNAGFRWIVDKSVDNNSLDYLFGLNPDGSIRFITRNLANDVSGPVLPFGSFTHVAAVQDASAGVVRLYVNGQQVNISQLGGSPVTNNADLLIGARHNGSNTAIAQFFKGRIDEVRIYNTAHTAQEIAAQYNKEANGPVSLWAAEGNANDLVDGNHGTLVNGTGFAPGKFGQAFSFDGVDDDVLIGASGNLDVGLAAGFSFDAWIFPTGSGGPIAEYKNGVHLWTDLTSRLFANIVDTGTNSHVILVSNVITQNAWNHVALTYSKVTGTATLYVNGVAVATQNLGIFTPKTSTALHIGHRPPSSFGVTPPPGFTFNGLIDEVKIYNRALTDCEVAVNALQPCNQSPDAICQNVTVNTTPGLCTANASVNNGSFDPDQGDSITLVQTPPGSTPPTGPYSLGTTNVTLTATDTHGATDSCTATITVVDNQNPSITCPANQTRECVGGGATATYTTTASDNCGFTSTTCSPASGATFPLGTTNVSCTATDGSGNTNSCNTSVTVQDTQAPSITCPASATVNTSSQGGVCSASLSVAATATDTCNGTISATCSPSLLSLSAPGSASSTCSATDTSNNSSSCGTTLTLIDNTPPTVSCVESVNPSGKNVPKASNTNQDGFYKVSGGDNCSGATTITLGGIPLANGETIKITQTPGKSSVTFVNTMGPLAIKHFQVGPGDAVITATDGSGNTSSVTCLVPPPPK